VWYVRMQEIVFREEEAGWLAGGDSMRRGSYHSLPDWTVVEGYIIQTVLLAYLKSIRSSLHPSGLFSLKTKKPKWYADTSRSFRFPTLADLSFILFLSLAV
jgi:hypothetical protein